MIQQQLTGLGTWSCMSLFSVHHADNVASWHHSCRTAHNTEARPMGTTVLVLQQGCLPPSVTVHGTDASIPMFLGLSCFPRRMTVTDRCQIYEPRSCCAENQNAQLKHCIGQVVIHQPQTYQAVSDNLPPRGGCIRFGLTPAVVLRQVAACRLGNHQFTAASLPMSCG